MNNLNGVEIATRRKQLEQEAAAHLGHMIFGFSRLDMTLGLCLVWVDSGARLESQTECVERFTFHEKLMELKRCVAKLPAGSRQQNAYDAWIKRAHAMRHMRNELTHGRWGIDPSHNLVVNVIGLPTSPTQRSTSYTIKELACINDTLTALERDLNALRERWPP